MSQLERLVFSESFVKEELKTDPPKNKKSKYVLIIISKLFFTANTWT